MSHACKAASPAPRPVKAFGARGRLSAVVLLLMMALQPGPAVAAPDWMRGAQEQLEPNNLVRPSGISVERCANLVRRETGGRVLSATPVERGGVAGCEVRVLVDGKRVKSLFVDSQGRVRGK